MKKSLRLVSVVPTLAATLLITYLYPLSVAAIDLSYNPELDAPKSEVIETTPDKTTSNQQNRLPGERLEEEQRQPVAEEKLIESESTGSGWSFKAPSVSSDKDPLVKDQREAVRMSEQKAWQSQDKNYDEDPLNSSNYRINVEAEYTF